MPNLTLRNIPAEDYAELRQDARQNRRSVNAEVLTMISRRVEMNRRRRQAAKVIQKLRKEREQIAREYPHQPDSADLVREDRDSR
jgi:plasmid stability protein